MNHSQLGRVHALAGVTAFCVIACFFTASLLAELSGETRWILFVKKAIFYGMWVMPVLMPVTALTGNRLAGKSPHPLVQRKKKRIRWVAVNGLVLLGLATFLFVKSVDNKLDLAFRSAQLAEFGLGATNLVLLGRMIRDGLNLRPKTRDTRLTDRPTVGNGSAPA